jgi:TPP-dependent pyruvate/acetoin dehydrogenase alpha subunit
MNSQAMKPLEGFSHEELLAMYEGMLLIRRFEERIDDLFAEGVLTGTCHLGIGQEAAAVGAARGLRPDDWMSSTHRGHGHFLAKGAEPARVMAEMFGKAAGYSGGRGGSQHMACFEIGFLGSNGITGGGIPVGTGAALALKRRNATQIVAVFMGDGAANQGVFHEALNMAALWKLPVIYLCENNRYAMSMPFDRAFATPTIAERVQAFGVPARKIDGNDVLEVVRAVREAADRARMGSGPSFIELATYRFCGHSKSDRCEYRTNEEEKANLARCPIKLLGDRLFSAGILDEPGMSQIDERVRKRIEQAETFARSAPVPDQTGEVFSEP